MKLTNSEIYNFAINYQTAFMDFTAYIPAKANFRLQKNITIMTAAAAEIDELRVKILKQYGKEEEGKFIIPKINADIVQTELNDLLTQEQELDIKMINIDDFGLVEFTSDQMKVLMFMIEE